MRSPLQTLARHASNLQNVVWNSRALFDDPAVWLPSAMEYLVYIGGMYDELVPRIVSAYASKPGLRDSVLWSMASTMYEAQETVYGGVVFSGLRSLGVPPTEPPRPVPDTTPTAEQLRAAERGAEGAVESVRARSGRTPTGATRATAQTIIEEIKRQYPDAFSTIEATTTDARLVEGVNEVKAQLAETKALINEVAANRVAATGDWKSGIVSVFTTNKAGPMVQKLAASAIGLAFTGAGIALALWAVGKGGASLAESFGFSSREADAASARLKKEVHDTMIALCGDDAACKVRELRRFSEEMAAGAECSMLATPYGTVLGGLAGIALGWAGILKLKRL